MKKLCIPSLLMAAITFASCGGNASNTGKDSAKGKDTVTKTNSGKTAAVVPAAPAPYKASDPAQLEKDIKAGKIKVYFQGMGTEPFWTVYITHDELLYVHEDTDEKQVYELVDKGGFNGKLKKQEVKYKNGNAVSSVLITLGEASLGMGPDMYPYGIKIGEYLEGGGDTLFIKDYSKYEREVN